TCAVGVNAPTARRQASRFTLICSASACGSCERLMADSLCMPWTERIRASRVREICTHGLKRAEAAGQPAPPLLDWLRPPPLPTLFLNVIAYIPQEVDSSETTEALRISLPANKIDAPTNTRRDHPTALSYGGGDRSSRLVGACLPSAGFYRI